MDLRRLVFFAPSTSLVSKTLFFLFGAFSGRYVCNNFRVNSSDLKEPDLGGTIIIGNSSQHAPSVRFG